ncbi:MAG: hypothetical protein HY816_20060 [Candidatus Wallbacteria bacterium]|nr:hypothetical protein [Candidatus Wallbacteria bacterium]
MAKIKIVHDPAAETLNIWWRGDGADEYTTIPIKGVPGSLYVSVDEKGCPLGFGCDAFEDEEVTVELVTLPKRKPKAA